MLYPTKRRNQLLIRAKSWKIYCIDCSVISGPPGIAESNHLQQVNVYLKVSTCWALHITSCFETLNLVPLFHNLIILITLWQTYMLHSQCSSDKNDHKNYHWVYLLCKYTCTCLCVDFLQTFDNTKQRKLIHWNQRNLFVISGILLYQISLYRVSTVLEIELNAVSLLASSNC